eukprot:2451185-Prorocentrum_lima.AAC.1
MLGFLFGVLKVCGRLQRQSLLGQRCLAKRKLKVKRRGPQWGCAWKQRTPDTSGCVLEGG